MGIATLAIRAVVMVGIGRDEGIIPRIKSHRRGGERNRPGGLDHRIALGPTVVTRLGIPHEGTTHSSARAGAGQANAGASHDRGEFFHGGEFPGRGALTRGERTVIRRGRLHAEKIIGAVEGSASPRHVASVSGRR